MELPHFPAPHFIPGAEDFATFFSSLQALMKSTKVLSVSKTIFIIPPDYSFTFFKRSAFAMTETELKLIAAAAMIGESTIPKNG